MEIKPVPDCRLCQYVRQLNLFKDEFFCGSPIRCENANRFVMIGTHPIALWEKRERATF